MGKKDSKTKAAEKKARTIAKQSKKAGKKEKKDQRKGKDQDNSESEDEDLDTILEEYAKQVGSPKKFMILNKPLSRRTSLPLCINISSIPSCVRTTLR